MRYLVDEETGCHVWQGSTDQKGYALVSIEGNSYRAHRVAYIMAHGPLGVKNVMHVCDNPPCINPDHLRAGTQLQNIADMVAKNRQAKGTANGRAGGKLTDQDVLDIRASTERGCDLAEKYGVGRPIISQIRNGRKWKHLLPSGFQEPPLRDDSRRRSNP